MGLNFHKVRSLRILTRVAWWKTVRRDEGCFRVWAGRNKRGRALIFKGAFRHQQQAFQDDVVSKWFLVFRPLAWDTTWFLRDTKYRSLNACSCFAWAIVVCISYPSWQLMPNLLIRIERTYSMCLPCVVLWRSSSRQRWGLQWCLVWYGMTRSL